MARLFRYLRWFWFALANLFILSPGAEIIADFYKKTFAIPDASDDIVLQVTTFLQVHWLWVMTSGVLLLALTGWSFVANRREERRRNEQAGKERQLTLQGQRSSVTASKLVASHDIIVAAGDVKTGGHRIESVVGDYVAGNKIVHIASATTPATAPHQFPRPPGDFTGRETELNELLAAIDAGGVTIAGVQGMGGIGKTALALKLAEKLTSQYSDAQFYLDLKGTSSQPLSITDAMTHVIRSYYPTGKLPDQESELAGFYRSVLHGKRALLLMDNVAGREHIEPLVPPTGCVLIATSRQHFTLPGLFAKLLDFLPPDDAHDLLLTIASRIGAHAPDLARLCGYLPLALRVTASSLAEHRDLSLEVFVQRLTDVRERLKLTGIEASLKLSFDLLNPELQKRWCTLAVFPDTFDSRAAAAVWSEPQN